MGPRSKVVLASVTALGLSWVAITFFRKKKAERLKDQALSSSLNPKCAPVADETSLPSSPQSRAAKVDDPAIHFVLAESAPLLSTHVPKDLELPQCLCCIRKPRTGSIVKSCPPCYVSRENVILVDTHNHVHQLEKKVGISEVGPDDKKEPAGCMICVSTVLAVSESDWPLLESYAKTKQPRLTAGVLAAWNDHHRTRDVETKLPLASFRCNTVVRSSWTLCPQPWKTSRLTSLTFSTPAPTPFGRLACALALLKGGLRDPPLVRARRRGGVGFSPSRPAGGPPRRSGRRDRPLQVRPEPAGGRKQKGQLAYAKVKKNEDAAAAALP